MLIERHNHEHPRRLIGQAAILAVLSSFSIFSTDTCSGQGGPPSIPPGSQFPPNSWSLSALPWDSDFGDPARAYTGLNVVPGWSNDGTCLSVDTNCAYLNLEVYQQPDSWTNISVDSSNGSLSFWYQANYTSVADGGDGPGNWAALINIGAYTTNATVGDWLLAIDPPASNILFLTASGGSRQVVFKYPIDMDAGDWWQIGVSWSDTNTCLYLNGQLATNGGPVVYRPTYGECLEYGFFVGSLGTNGNGQARGQFQNLLSYDYPLSPDEVARDYAGISAAILDWGATIRGGGGFHANDSGPPEVGGGDGGGSTNSPPAFNFTQPTNGLWLEMTGVSNGTAYLNLHNATNYVYEVFSTTDLSAPWNIETEVFPGTNQPTTPFTVPQSERGDLFLWARDWTGITSNGNQTPDWWFWYYFGTLGLSDTNMDSAGNTLISDYQNGMDPNVIAFNLAVTNQYVKSGNVPLQITGTTGTPFYMATLVDDTNLADANWIPYNPSPLALIGTNEGWHQIWFGLRGLPPDGKQTWAWTRVKLLTPPVLVITNPASSTVMQPMIEVQGFSPQPLASLTFDLSNAAGLWTNRQAFVLAQCYDTNTMSLTTNTFQAFDVPLSNGANLLTFHATDPAGNVSTTNFAYALNYAGRTNPPVVQLYWPLNGTQIPGSSFTQRGSVDDFTTTLQATITDASGHSNSVSAIVERNGNFWIENLPLAAGSNQVTLTAIDVASNVTTTNISVIGSSLVLTMNAVNNSQLWQSTEQVSGTISDPTMSVWVNGVEGANHGDGTWDATVPTTAGGTAVFQTRAIANTDNGGSGTGAGGGTPTFVKMCNPASDTAVDVEMSQDRPARLYGSRYSMNVNETSTQFQIEWPGSNDHITNIDNWAGNIFWSDGAAGSSSDVTTKGENGDIGTFEDDWSIPASDWGENVCGTENWGPYTWPLCMGVDFPEEYCDVDLPTNYDGAVYYGVEFWWWKSTYLRQAQLNMQFDAGGKGVPGGQNLFLVTASATDMLSTNPILPQSISIGSLGNLDSNGNLWVTLPSGDPDVTPKVAGKQYYTFTLNGTLYSPNAQCVASTPTNTARTTIGVGEKVTVGFSPWLPVNATWSVSAGSISPARGTMATFTAPSTAAANVTVRATIGNTTISFPPFTVVAPSGVDHADIVSTNSYPAGQAAAGMQLYVTFAPTNVCFSNVSVMEVQVPATNIYGWFTNSTLQHLVDTNANKWVPLNSDNQLIDTVGGGPYTNWSSGGYTLITPNVWQVSGSAATNAMVSVSTIRVIDPSGTVTVQKCGRQIQRTTNNVITTN